MKLTDKQKKYIAMQKMHLIASNIKTNCQSNLIYKDIQKN